MTTASAHNVDPRLLENRLLAGSSSRSFFALYTSRGYANREKCYELVFAWGAREVLDAQAIKAGRGEGQWRFGFLGYELRTEFEELVQENPRISQWPDAQFFIPEVVGTLDAEGTLNVEAFGEERAEVVLQSLLNSPDVLQTKGPTSLDFKPIESREQYLQAILSLQHHIQMGDIYEVNYCTGFKAEFEELATEALFERMAAGTDAPFSAYTKMGAYELLCTSPERYLLKVGDRLISQPIKGTNRRSSQDNAQAQKALLDSEKERAENVMIVDLVRNDLSRIAQRSTVEVSELFGTYGFKNVNQLISTVEAKVRPEVSFWEILGATYPMGSMTGAPKIRAMELAEAHEKSAREVYSGALGYMKPNGDFDFNVVIRSIAVNRNLGMATLHVGGAITILSDPEAEYEECLLKAESMIRAAQ